MKRTRSHTRAALAALSIALTAGLWSAAPAAAAGSATWTGADASDTWSTGGNWSGVAPHGSVDSLTLPPSGSSCVSWACTYGVDDIPSLTVGSLQIDSSTNYLITPLSAGNTIRLLGGLTFATTATPSANRLLTQMVVPLTLGAPQTWSISGVPGTATQLSLGTVSGERFPLTLQLSDNALLQTPELDTGALTIGGSGTVTIAGQTAQPADGIPTSPPPLVSADGVRLQQGASLAFASAGAVSGPIAIAPGSYSTLEIGRGVAPDGTVVVNGDVTLRTTSTLQLWIDQPGATVQPARGTTAARRHPAARRRPEAPIRPLPSSDYSQLTTLGTLNLNDAALTLAQGYSDTQVDCASLAGGQTYTLISAMKLVGSFDHVANGQVVPLGACDPLAGNPPYAVIISYNTSAYPQTVTATVVGAGQVRALVGRTLAVAPAQARLKTILHHGYATIFNAPALGTLQLTWTARVHRRLVTVASATNIAGQVGPRRVPLHFTGPGRRLLRRSKRLTLTATAAFVPSPLNPFNLTDVTIRRPVRLH